MKQVMYVQPDILTDTVAEVQHTNTSTIETLPDKIRLLVTSEVMRCRKVRAVVRFHTPNKRKEPENFFLPFAHTLFSMEK